MEVQVCLNQDVVSSKPRTGEVTAILPDGTHIEPPDVALWIDEGLILAVSARNAEQMKHVRYDHIANRDGFTQIEQDKLAAFMEGFTFVDPKGRVESFTLSAGMLRDFDANSNFRHQQDAYLWIGLPEDDDRRQLASKIAHRYFAKKWAAQREVAVRAFWDEYGYDSAGWGEGDLRSSLILKMDLTWDQAFELREGDRRFIDGKIKLIRARKKKLNLGFLSPETRAILDDKSTIVPIRYDKSYTADVVTDADDAIGG